MVVRYSRWTDRLRARFPGKRQRTRVLTQAMMDDLSPEIEAKARDLILYGCTYIDQNGNRIDPASVRVYDH